MPGFFIHSLNGFPMMYVKPVLQAIGIRGILKLVKGNKRDCEFREVLSFSDSLHATPKIFIRVVKGTLAHNISGEMSDTHWSELALVFIPENETKTMADMNETEYTAFRKAFEKDSHFEQFGKYYSPRE